MTPTVGVGGDDENRLVRRAVAGDVGAFEALYRQHLGRVHGLCRRLTGDPSLAEELTQEAFVLAWRQLASFRGDSSFATWLHRLACNVVFSALRRRGRWAGREVDWSDVGEQPGAEMWSPPAVVSTAGEAARVNAIDLERAIAELPSGARAVFVLAAVYGLAHDEIASRAGIAVGTSKAQLHRARLLLRRALSR